MFTGIIEAMGSVTEVVTKGTNRTFRISSPLATGFKVDQSIAHNGVCLTVEEVAGEQYQVTAVEETLNKTALGTWTTGTAINLERSLLPSSRLDGHFVQGHVDTTGACTGITDRNGSFEMRFSFPPSFAPLVIEKGSVCINGVSLTAFNVSADGLTVAIIPYTWSHTNLQYLSAGDAVNLEFDMIGKYVVRWKDAERSYES